MNKCKQCKCDLLTDFRDICSFCQNENRNNGVKCHACCGDAGYITHTCGK